MIDMFMWYMCDNGFLMLIGLIYNFDIMFFMIRMRMLGRINFVVLYINWLIEFMVGR